MQVRNIKTERVMVLGTKDEQNRFFDNRDPKDWKVLDDSGGVQARSNDTNATTTTQ